MTKGSTDQALRTVVIRDPPLELKRFDAVPRDRVWTYFFYGIAALPFFSVFWLMVKFMPKHLGYLGFALFLLNVGVGVVLSFASFRSLRHVLNWRQMHLDFGRLASRPEGARYVGVAYGDGDFQVKGRSSWDRGYLWFAEGRLVFAGYGPFMCMPNYLVDSVSVRRTESPFAEGSPRVVVEWHTIKGVRNVLSFEVLDGGTRDRTAAQTAELAQWITAGLEGPEDASDSPLMYAFPSSSLDFKNEEYQLSLKRADYLWAALVSMGCIMVCGTIGARLMDAFEISPRVYGPFEDMVVFGAFTVVLKRLARVRRVLAARRSNTPLGPFKTE